MTLYEIRAKELESVTEAALALDPSPPWTYKPRHVQTIAIHGPHLNEHLVYNEWCTDPKLRRIAASMHHALCAMNFERITDAINQWVAEEDEGK